MPHSYTRIWVHGIFHTKNNQIIIPEEFEQELITHMKKILAENFQSAVKAINVYRDHVHILFNLNPNYALKNILQQLKGETSHRWNQMNYTPGKFMWQSGYSALSVSPKILPVVEKYILNQKQHHKKISSKEELEKFLIAAGAVPGKDFNKDDE